MAGSGIIRAMSNATQRLLGEDYKCAICGSSTLERITAIAEEAGLNCQCVCGLSFTLPSPVGTLGEPLPSHWLRAAAEEDCKRVRHIGRFRRGHRRHHRVNDAGRRISLSRKAG